MLTRRACLMWLAGFLLAATASNATADGFGSPRQYYSGWNKAASYSYRNYYYKPTPNYSGYKHHYVVYYPSRPKYVYYYNPYKKVFWGRCEIERDGQALYSLLAEQDRRGSIQDIPEKAFPAPSAVPPLPESTDKTPLDLPPDDAPDASGLPISP